MYCKLRSETCFVNFGWDITKIVVRWLVAGFSFRGCGIWCFAAWFVVLLLYLSFRVCVVWISVVNEVKRSCLVPGRRFAGFQQGRLFVGRTQIPWGFNRILVVFLFFRQLQLRNHSPLIIFPQIKLQRLPMDY